MMRLNNTHPVDLQICRPLSLKAVRIRLQIRQTIQLSRLTLRIKKPELVEQELWGALLAYNLVRYQMIKMAKHLKGY